MRGSCIKASKLVRVGCAAAVERREGKGAVVLKDLKGTCKRKKRMSRPDDSECREKKQLEKKESQ